ncbi:PepSY domain-containing protein [Gymnodinialimonas sp.]
MTMFNKPVILAALLCPTIAFAQIGVGDVAGTDEAQILAFLEADGYTIQEVETEGDELEVYAMLDGVLFEIEVDLETGQIAEIELEDEEDDDDDADGDDSDDA